MNILGFTISVNRNSKIENRKSLSFDPQAWLAGTEYRGPSITLQNAYEQVPWVYRAINVLAEQVANVPFLFSRGERGRENLITSGPLLDFYNRPHPRLNRFQYWELRVLWLMLRGECFRLPIYGSARTGRRVLKSILLLDPDRFQHVVEDHQLVGWRYQDSSKASPVESQIFLPEDIWFDRLPNPFNFWRGLAPLYLAESAAKADFTASAFMHGLLANNAENGFIVRTDQQLTDEQREQIVSTLRNRKRGAGTADATVLLWGTNEIMQPKISSADLQFLENRRFSRAEICAAFGVPEEIVTTTDHNKYDVMQGARLNFIENRVATLCARLAAEEQATIKAIDPTAVGWFDLDSLPIMQQARRARLASAKIGFDMGIPFNELNRAFDLGFPPLPWGNTGYLPSTLVQLSNTTPTQKNP